MSGLIGGGANEVIVLNVPSQNQRVSVSPPTLAWRLRAD